MEITEPRSEAPPFDPCDPAAVESAFADLLAAPADEEGLRRWGALDIAIEDRGGELYLGIHRRPTDAEVQDAYARWAGVVRPLADAHGATLAARYPDPAPTYRGFVARRAAGATHRPDPELAAREQALQRRYLELLRGLFPVRLADGRTLDRAAFVAMARSSDRAARAEAWRAREAARAAIGAEVDELYTELVSVRHAMAVGAGFASHREYRYRQLGRDWDPTHAAALRDVIERAVVPAVAQIEAERARGLGALEPWDDDVHEDLPSPPYATLLDVVGRCVARLGPEPRAIWEDLRPRIDHQGPEPRQTADFHQFSFADRRSTLFLSPGGGPWDLATLLHEVGHALHHTSSARAHPGFLTDPPIEIAELAAQGHELVQLDAWSEVFGADGARLRALAVRRAVITVVDAALWDAYQDWAAMHPEHTVAERQAEWRALVARFKPDRAEGAWAEAWEGARIRAAVPYVRPFYALEYAMSSFGALQLAERHAREPAAAVAGYLALLRSGLDVSPAEAYARTGVSWLPDAQTAAAVMRWVVGTVASGQPE